MDPVWLGISLLSIGLLAFTLVQLSLRAYARQRMAPNRLAAETVTPPPDNPAAGLLLVGPGGRLLSVNPRARQWFQLSETEPALDQLAYHVKPSEAFYRLCAAPGQANFALNNLTLEGQSFAIPYGTGQAFLVSLLPIQTILTATNHPDRSTGSDLYQSIRLFTALGEALHRSLDINETLQVVLESLTQLIPADFPEICLWNSEREVFEPYCLVGEAGEGMRLERHPERDPKQDGLAAALVHDRSTLMLSNTTELQAYSLDQPSSRPPCRAFLGFPLQHQGKLIATVEFAAFEAGTYHQEHLDIIQLFAGLLAVALHNSRQYSTVRQHNDELLGLTQLNDTLITLQDAQKLYVQLIDHLADLIAVKVIGFLLYDENRHMLMWQAPIRGLPENVVGWTHVKIPPGSAAEMVWQKRDLLLATDAANDQRLAAYGLDHLAQAAGISQMAFIPLLMEDSSLGYLVVADKLDGTSFEPGDIRRLTLVARQIAPLIQNAALVAQSRRRAMRAETLQHIASLTGSAAGKEEILQQALLDLARLLEADFAAVFLLEEGLGELRVHRESLYGVTAESAAQLGRLPIDDPQFYLTVTGSQRTFASDNLSEDGRVLPLYRPLVNKLGVESAIVAPLVVRDRGIGELMIGGRQRAHFNPLDMQAVSTVAGQLAAAIEQSHLQTQTDEDLRRRVDQLTALTRLSREMNSILDLEYLLRRVYDEAIQATGADCGSVALIKMNAGLFPPPGEPENGSAYQVVFTLGESRPQELSPLELAALEGGESVLVPDYQGLDAEPTTPQPSHPGVRTALIVPLSYQESLSGVIHLHAGKPGCFDRVDREIVESLAVQAAIALGNALRFQEQVRRGEQLNRRVETLAKLHETAQTLHPEQPLDQALENIACAIQSATPFNSVLISVYEPTSGLLERYSGAGLSTADMDALRAHPQSWEYLQTVLRPQFRLGRAYFIPYEQMPVVPVEIHTLTTLPLDDFQANGKVDETWHPEDMLAVPIETANNELLGLISVDAPRDRLRPDRPTIETLEIFASQAALVIQNQRQIHRYKEETGRMQASLEVAQQQLPVLLDKDQQHTHTIQQLGHHVDRLRAIFELAYSLPLYNLRSDLLPAIAEGLFERLNFDVAIVAEPGNRGAHLLYMQGSLPPESHPEALLGQRNPLQSCLEDGKILLVSRLEADSSWSGSPLMHALDAHSLICLPFQAGEQIDAALLLTRNSPLPAFSDDDEQLFAQFAQMVSARLQNIYLLEDTRHHLAEVNMLLDFNHQLNSLDATSILQTLASSARQVVPAAQASLVATWDNTSQRLKVRAASGYPDNQAMEAISFGLEDTLPGQVYSQASPQRIDEIDFIRCYSLSSADLVHYRDGTAGRFPLSSLAMPIRLNQDSPVLGVLVLDNFLTGSAFTVQAEALIAALTQQAALNLEHSRLFHVSEARAGQLQALTGVSTTLAANLHQEELVGLLLDQLGSILPYATATLWIREGIQLVVRAVRGFTDQEQRLGLAVAVEDSALLNQMVQTSQPISVGDVTNDPRFSSLLDNPNRSWLGVPLISGDEVIGVIAMEQGEAHAYAEEDVQLAVTFAGQAAVALINASLYQQSVARAGELDQRSQRLEMLYRLSQALSETLEPDQLLRQTMNELSLALNCQQVAAVIFNPQDQPTLQVELPESPGESPGNANSPVLIPDAPIFERLRQSLGILNIEAVEQEPSLAPLADFLAERGAQALLAISLASSNELFGVLLVITTEARRFTVQEVGLARTISNQAAIALQNARLYAETRLLTEDLDQRVRQRTTQLAQEHQRTEILLRIMTELSASLDLEQVLNRTLEVLNEVVDAEQITVLLSRQGEKKLHLLASVGLFSARSTDGHITSLDPSEGLAGWVIQNRQAALIGDVTSDPRWVQRSGRNTDYRSVICVPMLIGAESLGALMFIHRTADRFSSHQLDLVQAAANQVAVAVNNSELYHLIRDQAEDLGKMVRSQQIETQRTKAILEDVADGVLVTDNSMQITLFNDAAGQILGLERDRVVGRSLDHFTGLFGPAAQTWKDTIRQWSQDPASYHPGDTYAERITLDTGRVVSVHLSPVNLGNVFLGTVSIFRDITHQVEVDRLKSEFVATVSHELRTPMTSIKGYVDILLMGAAGDLNAQQAQFLQVVKANTERLAILVNDLLDVSRIESGHVTLSLQPLDLSEVVRNAGSDLKRRSQVESKFMHIDYEIPVGLSRAVGDLERVRQIIDNLLKNAYDYTAPGGQILLRLSQTGDEVQLDVQDNGIGVPPELQPRVFERFYRGEHPFVLATSGTGLGLSIVKELVAMHQGRIWITSTGIPGEGSTFSFTLPVYSPES